MHQERNWVPCGAHLTRLSSNQALNRCRELLPLLIWQCISVYDGKGSGAKAAPVLITSRLTPEGWDVCWCPDLICTPIITSRGLSSWHYGETEWVPMGPGWQLTLGGHRTPEKGLMMRGRAPSDWCLVGAVRLNQYHPMRCLTALDVYQHRVCFPHLAVCQTNWVRLHIIYWLIKQELQWTVVDRRRATIFLTGTIIQTR